MVVVSQAKYLMSDASLFPFCWVSLYAVMLLPVFSKEFHHRCPSVQLFHSLGLYCRKHRCSGDCLYSVAISPFPTSIMFGTF